jgi:hypothetical protein
MPDNETRRIRWVRSNEDITRLNGRVAEKVALYVKEKAENIPTKREVAPEIEYMLKNTSLRIYKHRSIAVPILIALGCSCTLFYHLHSSPIMTFSTIIIMFLYYDFFSGVLHLVLDEPKFIGMPLIGDACLEFQWHHHLSDDLTQKSFLEVCGDLNLVCVIIAVKDLVIFRNLNPASLCLLSAKLLMAYFGQLCHTMSHTPKKNRPYWVIALQDRGLMISSRDHMTHHMNHDDNFCIGSGIFNPALRGIHSVGNRWFWLYLFLTLGIIDVYAINSMLSYCGVH